MPPKKGIKSTNNLSDDDTNDHDNDGQGNQNDMVNRMDQIFSMLTDLSARMSDIEKSNAEIKLSNAELKGDLNDLRQSDLNDLRRSNAELKGDLNDLRANFNGTNNNGLQNPAARTLSNVNIGLPLHPSSSTQHAANVNSNATEISRNVENDVKDLQSRENAVENGNNVNATVSDGSINTRNVAQSNANSNTNIGDPFSIMNKLSLIQHEVSNLGMERLARLAIFLSINDIVINEMVKLIPPEPPPLVILLGK